jgi:HSP20 family protein
MLTLRTPSPFDLFERLEQQLHNAERVPAAEVHETDNAYEVVLELPGVDKDAIDVKATDRTLLISAERRNPQQNPLPQASEPDPSEAAPSPEATAKVGRGPLLSEFRYGTWSRSFRFPSGIDRENLSAHYQSGLLSVRVPKAQTMTTVSVKVEG